MWALDYWAWPFFPRSRALDRSLLISVVANSLLPMRSNIRDNELERR